MAGKASPSQRPFFEKYLPYLLFVLIGYGAADLVILKYRDLMLPTEPPPARPKSFLQDSSQGRGAYNTIIARNIFSLDGTIPDQLVAQGEKAQDDSNQTPVLSSLPLTLKGTIVSSIPEKSIASIEVKSKNQVLPFVVGREIEGLAMLTKVERNKAIFRNLNNNRMEFIEMKTDAGKVSFSASKSSSTGKTDVMQTAPDKFEIKRSDILKYTADMGAVLQQASMVPRRGASGEIECFKFLAIQPGSIYTQLGFQTGDCIKGVNGEKVDSAAKAMQLYNALKNSDKINLQMERDGRDRDFDYTVK